MEKGIVDLLQVILTENGFAAFVLIVVSLGMCVLYWLERKDRREAWKAHNNISKETNEVLKGLQLVLEGINHKLR